MSSHNFSEPEKFQPERWLEGKTSGDSLEATKPFSLGTRSCLGRRLVTLHRLHNLLHSNIVFCSLAWLEMNVTLTRLLFCYDISADGVVEWHQQSEMHLLWKKPELRVKLSRRNK